MNSRNLLLVCFTLSSLVSNAQLHEETLTNPTKGKLSGHDRERTIYYGYTPDNWNGKTIVFTHGYNSNNSTFIDGKSVMYKWAFNQGYKTIFISTTEGGTMELNAEIFAQGLDQVKEKTGTSKFYMVGYSNGGKSIDLALSIHNKKDMAIKAVTLGTPFKGTQIANLGQWPGISWLTSFMMPGDGQKTSTTYYMEKIRKIIDNSPNNEPDKFYHIGHTGYKNSDTSPTKYAKYLAAGNLIKLMGGGNNDGTTPYYSHSKPNAHIVLAENEGKKNHSQLPYDIENWNRIDSIFNINTAINTAIIPKTSVLDKTDITTTEFSDYQLMYNGHQDLIVKNDGEKYELISLKEREREESYRTITPSAVMYQKGAYKIESTNHQNFLNVYKSLEKNGFILQRDAINNRLIIRDLKNKDIKGSTIKAETYHISDNNTTSIGTDKRTIPLLFTYEPSIMAFTASLSDFKDGVYAMNIHVENEYYARDLISGFVAGNINFKPLELKKVLHINHQKSTVIVNNGSKNAYIQITESIQTPIQLSIYDASGRILFNETYKKTTSSVSLSFIQEKGVYLINLNYNSKTVPLKYLIR
ncbi:T9SS type A sorting domain-containing protein [Chryseobacterium indologenes]|uniref:T9SS type A sorting domain-containing protein n=1 Tax=Chryseobacterium indologenes TaxID=253 RepID=UPI0021A5A28E|nr:T9SS type A sorting domain-containing protein [Elizabethkingia anophelis]